MAALTWRNVDAPSFSSSNEMWRLAATLMNKGFESASDGLQKFKDTTTEEQSAALMQSVIGAGNDPAAAAAAVRGANPSFLSADALKFANNQPGVLLDREGKALQNTGQGILNGYNTTRANEASYDFGQKQTNDAARPDAMAAFSSLSLDLNSNDPAVRAAAEARSADVFKTYGGPMGIKSMGDLQTAMSNNQTMQNMGIKLNENRLAFNKTLDTTTKSLNEDDAFNSVLRAYPNADQAIEVISNDPRIPAEMKPNLVKRITDYKAGVPGAVDPLADILGDSAVLPDTAAGYKDNKSVLPGYNPNNTVPGNQPRANSQVRNVLQGLVDRTEGGGNYDTLYGNAQRKGPLAGVDVSTQTIGTLKSFASKDGAYGQVQREKLGYLATPMGRYQIVGQTLAGAAKEMGLPDDTVFTPEVQDAMFNHIATKAISGPRTMEGKMAALRGQWEGFKNVSDAQLAAAITSYEGGQPLDLNNLQRGEVTGLYGNQNIQDTQRQYQADQAQARTNFDLPVNVNPVSNDPRALDPTVKSASSPLVLGQTNPDATSDKPFQQTLAGDLGDFPGQKGADPAAVAAAQRVIQNDSSTPGTDAFKAAATDATTKQADQQNADSEALTAGLTQIDPTITGGTTPVPAIQRNEEGELLTGQRDNAITQVDPKRSQFMQDVQGFLANGDKAKAYETLRTQAGIAASPAADAWGAVSDYFSATPEEGKANAAIRAEKQQVSDYYNDPKTKQYFYDNPEQFQIASADPNKYALGKLATPATTTATTKDTATAPAVTTDTNAKPSTVTKPLTDDEKAEQAMANMTPRDRLIYRMQTAKDMNAFFAARRATSDLNEANHQNASIDKAVRSRTDADLPITDLATKYAGAVKSTDKDGKTTGSLTEYQHGKVTRAIDQLAGELGVNNGIAAALLKEAGTFSDNWLFDDTYSLDTSKARSIWETYQGVKTNADGTKSFSANDGIGRLTAQEQTEFQEKQFDALEKKYTDYQARLQAELAKPYLSDERRAAILKAQQELPGRIRQLGMQIIGQGDFTRYLDARKTTAK